MIPIVSVLSSISALISFFICFRLWRRFQTLGTMVLKQFAACYFFFGVFFLFFVIPGVIHFDGALIAMDSAMAYLSLFIAIAYFIQIPLEIFKYFFWARLVFWLTVLTGVILFIGNVIYSAPPIYISEGPFVYYIMQGNPLIQWLNAFIPVVFDIMGIIFFLSQGHYLARQNRDRENGSAATWGVVYRSYTIAIGWIILLIAGALNLYAITPTPRPEIIFLATAAAVTGLLVIFQGIIRAGSNF